MIKECKNDYKCFLSKKRSGDSDRYKWEFFWRVKLPAADEHISMIGLGWIDYFKVPSGKPHLIYLNFNNLLLGLYIEIVTKFFTNFAGALIT